MKITNFLITVFILFSYKLPVIFANWDEQLNSYSHLLTNEQLKLISEQRQAFIENKLVTTSDPIIVQIPTIENFEPLVDIIKEKNNRIKLKSILKKVPKNSKNKAHKPYPIRQVEGSHMRLEIYNRLKQTIIELDNLSEIFGYSPKQINVIVTEGLRSVQTQLRLFNDKSILICRENPEFSKSECDNEAKKWVSPVQDNIPPHSTGGAVDIKLYDSKGKKFLDLGIYGTHIPNSTAPTFSDELSEIQIKNRLFLLFAAIKAGLVNYPYEFWHYSNGDCYAAYWFKQPHAIYDSKNIEIKSPNINKKKPLNSNIKNIKSNHK